MKFNPLDWEIIGKEVLDLNEKDILENYIMSDLYSVISLNQYLDPLMEKAFKYLGNPISYHDYSHKIISCKFSDPIENKIWKENLESGDYAYNTLHETFYEDVEKVTRQREPFIIKLIDDNCLTCSVMYNNNLLGFISILEVYRPIEEMDSKILRAVADIIAVKSVKDNLAVIEDDYVFGNVFKNLIEGNINTENEFHFQLGTQNWIQKPIKNVLVVDIPNNASEAYITYMKQRIKNIYSNVKIIGYKHNIVILGQYQKEEDMVFHDKIIDYISQCKLKTGISNRFSDILDLKKYYEQAVKALYFNKLLKLNQLINIYSDFQFLDFMKQCYDKIDCEDYYHSIVEELRDYDDKKQSELGKTLYYYLDNNKSIAETSLKMHLHKNTINFRINKIKQLCKTDLNNYQEVLHILLSYKLKYLYSELNN